MSVDSREVLSSALRLRSGLTTFVDRDGNIAGPDIYLLLIRGLMTPSQLAYSVLQNIMAKCKVELRRPRIWMGQAQAYWVESNLKLYTLTGNEFYLNEASGGADAILKRQHSGQWRNDLIGLSNRLDVISNAWLAISLLDAYQVIGLEKYLTATLRFWNIFTRYIGFVDLEARGMCVRYFSGEEDKLVCNANTLLLSLVGRLKEHLDIDPILCTRVLRFLQLAQLPSGELPYDVATMEDFHYQCTQYNAFEILDLAEYYWRTRDERAQDVLKKALFWLTKRVTKQGRIPYDCFALDPSIVYHSSAVLAALCLAEPFGLKLYAQEKEAIVKLKDHVLNKQMSNGLFEYGTVFRSLQDCGSYVRQNCFVLSNLIDAVRFMSISPESFLRNS